LTKTELEWLFHNKELVGNYDRKIKSQIRKKLVILKVFLSHIWKKRN